MKKIYLILFLLFAFAVLTCTSGIASAITVEEGHIDSSDIKEKPVFLFFYADGCYLCQRQKPIIDELEQEYADKINFIRINGEQNPQMTEEFGVDAFPAMFLIADKNEEGYVYQQFRCFTEKTELRDSTTHALTSGDVRMRSTADDHIRSLSPCPPGSYARNCGGCPCECECYNGTIRKVVEYRSCKLGDVLVKDTTLTKDYTYTGSGRSHQKNFKLDEDGITLDCNGHTLDGAGVGVFDNNRVTIKNCVIVNSDCDGIYLYSSSNNNITGNTVSSNKNQGISLYDSSNNNITGNIASNNIHGIHLSSSSNNVVVNNIANSNGEGIHLWSSSSNNVITGNTASNNIYCGISLYDSSNNNDITSNTASNHSYNGIYLKSSNDNNITDNFASGNVGCGIILLSSSSKNVIFDNAVSNNGDGIGLSSSSNNDLTGNIVSNNDQGIYLDSSDDNTIYNNYFNNTYNAYDDGNNIWNIAKTSGTNIVCGPYLGGNYWSDYAGKDLDDDSLGDTPYNISGGSNKDYLPLVEFIDLWIDNLKIIQTASAANWTVDDSGGADFTGIQEAINKASVGDTIIVHSGVYYENVVVDKSVTLKGIGHPVVDANGSGSAITLSADGITLVGFTATNSDSYQNAGINVTSNNNTIIGNNASSNNNDGIHLDESCDNTISSNTACSNNVNGISLYDSCNNSITGNNVSNNRYDGIYIRLYSCNNTITGNNASSNNNDGIYLWHSCNNNTITGNNVNNNNDDGIYLWSSSNNNTITGNNVNSNNNDGIHLWYSSNNNTITGNNVSSNNNDGICLEYLSNNNQIYLNDFINNSDNAYSEESTNVWNTPEEITYTYNGSTYKSYLGNYWDDYKEKYPDAEEIDSTGIWDTPYNIDGDEDSYPLMQQWGNYHP